MCFGVTSYGKVNLFVSARRLKSRHGVCDAIDVDFGRRNNIDVENVPALPFELVVQRLDDGAQEHVTGALGILPLRVESRPPRGRKAMQGRKHTERPPLSEHSS